MCLNLCGASHYPMTKLFGRSPAGMNATGESDLKNYYDYVDSQREAKVRPVLQKLLPVLAMSAWGTVPDDLDFTLDVYKRQSLYRVAHPGLGLRGTAPSSLRTSLLTAGRQIPGYGSLSLSGSAARRRERRTHERLRCV